MSIDGIAGDFAHLQLGESYPTENEWERCLEKIESQSIPFSRSRMDYTPLEVAAILNDEEACGRVSGNINGALVYAVVFGSLAAASRLLDRGGDIRADLPVEVVQALPYPMRSIGQLIASSHQDGLFLSCITRGLFQANDVVVGFSLLAFVVSTQNRRAVKLLMERGGALNAPAVLEPETLKRSGMFKGKVPAEQEEEVLAMTCQASLLEHVAYTGNVEMWEWFCKHYSQEMSAYRDKEGHSIFHFLMYTPSAKEKVESLLRYGFDPRSMELDVLGRKEDVEILEWLCEEYPEIMHSYRGKGGNSLLGHFCLIAFEEGIQCLLRRGFDPKSVDESFRSPLHQTAFSSKKLSDKTLECLREADAGFTPMLDRIRLFGHRFALRGKAFEGFIGRFGSLFDPISHSLGLCQFQAIDPQAKQELIEDLALAKSGDTAAMIAHYRQKRAVVIPCEWPGHAVTIVFWEGICVKINGAQGYEDKPGVWFYTIDPSVSEEQLHKSMELLVQDKQKTEDVFFRGLEEQLGLDLAGWFSDVKQEVGNCSYFSKQYAVLAWMILHVWRRSGEKRLDRESFSKCIPEARFAFVMWEAMDRTLSLKDIQRDGYARWKQIVDMDGAFTTIMKRSLKENNEIALWHLLQVNPDLKDWVEPDEGRSLIHSAYLKNMHNMLYPYLCSVGANPYHKDHEGHSLSDFMNSPPV